MAESQVVGTAEVRITGDPQSATEALQKVIDKLTALNAELTKTEERLKKLGDTKIPGSGQQSDPGSTSAADRRRVERERAAAARATGVADSPQLKELKADVTLNIDTKSIVTQVESALSEHVFKITLDTADIIRQLSNIKISPTVTPTLAHGAAPAQAAPVYAAPAAVPAPVARPVVAPPSAALSAMQRAVPMNAQAREPFFQALEEMQRSLTGRATPRPSSESTGTEAEAQMLAHLTSVGRSIGLRPGSHSTPQQLATAMARKLIAAGVPKDKAGVMVGDVMPVMTPIMRHVTPEYAESFAPAPAPVQPSPQTYHSGPVTAQTLAELERRQRIAEETASREERFAQSDYAYQATGMTPEEFMSDLYRKNVLKPRRATSRGTSKALGVRGVGGTIVDQEPAIGSVVHRRSGAIAMRGVGKGGQEQEVDVTDIRTLIEQGGLEGWASTRSGQWARYPVRDGSYQRVRSMQVNGEQQSVRPLATNEMLRAVLQNRLGREVGDEELQAITRKNTRGKTAPRKGETVGAFANAIEAGRKIHPTGPLGPGHQGMFTGDMGSLNAAARDRLRQQRADDQLDRELGYEIPVAGDIPQRGDLEVLTEEQKASTRETNRLSRESQLRAQGRVDVVNGQLVPNPERLGISEQQRVYGEAQAEEAAGLSHAEALAQTLSLFEELLTPEQLPSSAPEDLGRYKKGDPLSTFQGLEYRANEIMAQTGIARILGIEQPGTMLAGSEPGVNLIKQLNRTKGGQQLGAALEAIRQTRFQQQDRETAEGRLAAGRDSAALTRHAKATVAQWGIKTPPAKTRRDVLETELADIMGTGGAHGMVKMEAPDSKKDPREVANSEERRIRAWARGRYRVEATSQALREKGYDDTSRYSSDEQDYVFPGMAGMREPVRKAIEARRDEIIEEKAQAGDPKSGRRGIRDIQSRQTELQAKIAREKEVERAYHAIIKHLQDTGTEEIEGVAPIDETTGQAFSDEILTQARADIEKARTTESKGTRRTRKASQIEAPVETKAAERLGLNRGATTMHRVGGQRATTIPGAGEHGEDVVIPLTETYRPAATRIKQEAPGPKPSLLGDTDEGVARVTEGRRGARRPAGIIEEIAARARQERMDSAFQMAKELSPDAGAMVVTIAGPFPLQVSVANWPATPPAGGGGASGGDGGKKPPTAEAGPPSEEPQEPKEVKTPRPLSLTEELAGERRQQEEGRLGAQLELEGRQTRAQEAAEKTIGEVAGPGYRLPALRNPPPGSGWNQQSQAGLQLERAQAAAAAKTESEQERERKKALRAESTRERNAIKAVGAEFTQEAREQDPLYAETMQRIEDRLGPDVTPERRAALYPKVRAALASRQRAEGRAEREGRRNARLTGQVGPPSEAALRAMVLRAGAASGDPALMQGLPERQFDAAALDEEALGQRALGRGRAAVQIAQGKLAQRALSTTMIQLSQNLIANREEPLERLQGLRRELSDLQKITRERVSAQSEGRLLREQRGIAARAQSVYAPDTEEYKRFIPALADFDEKLKENAATVEDLTNKEERQADNIDFLSKQAVKTSDVLRNLGAGFIGGIAGGFVTMAVGAMTQGLTQAMTKVVIPQLDKSLGNNLMAQGVMAQQAAAYAQGGFRESTIREQYAGAGYTAPQMMQMSRLATLQADAMAGAAQTQQRIDLQRTNRAITLQQRELGLPSDVAPGLFRGQGALLSQGPDTLLMDLYEMVSGRQMDFIDIGGSDSAAKILAAEIADIVPDQERRTGITPMGRLVTVEGGISAENDALVALNERLKSSGVTVTPGALDQPTKDLLKSIPGTADIINSLEQQGLTLTGATDLSKIYDFVSAATKPELDFGAYSENFLKGSQWNNQLWRTQKAFALQDSTLQVQQALAVAGRPETAFGTGIGYRPGQAPSRDLARSVETMDYNIASGVQEGLDDLVNVYGVSRSLVDEFSLLGERTADWTEEIGNIQAAQQLRQFNLQVTQARYQVADLAGLIGKSGGSEIGMLERQNMLMQRRLQMIQFEQQQRRINFGVAVAGFQSIGLTGEERAANIRIAQKEAREQQRMLNINRSMAGNQYQIVDQQNLRQFSLATQSLDNLLKSYDENTRIAELGQAIGRATRRQGQLEQKIQQAFQQEVQLINMRDDVIQKMADDTNKKLTLTNRMTQLSEILKVDLQKIDAALKDAKEALGPDGAASGQGTSVTINVQGHVVDMKRLVKMVEEELGHQGNMKGA